ncbi:Cys-tRNA(Pro) deacylase [Lacimicrobium alkaliphilum]|uniref:Cys-tRNA(Pro)/Cys-tRNA(Cys) deacylase n=1 Tax=Lacimicrobium alkaliphilum TaxID=1526571 RepID=A0ABQ1REZ3_9ALTE|nr:Cys-tRNA(Pro) deacylase [Lacimicrobium alkaliphilum]GGD64469.1 Cys-tRNA(Pro)/Cys-tRNA(Cys) deacylase [Lacimicrobium alkaliphilum]
MTPAITLLERKQVPFCLHEYTHEPDAESFGGEAAEKLGVDASYIFKTLVLQLDCGELLVAMVPVLEKLNLKQAAKAAGGKKAKLAEAQQVVRSTGYLLGGVSPLAQKKALPALLDESARHIDSIYVSGGKRGLEIELAPEALCKLTGAVYAPLCQTTAGVNQ